MEDKKNKPLRPVTSDKARDLQSAYFKDPGGREIPINTPEDKTIISSAETEEIQDKAKAVIDVQNYDDNYVAEESAIEDEKFLQFENKESELIEKIAVLEKEKEELKEQSLRKTAELDNMRRRSLKEKNEMIDYANQSLLQKMLPLVDDFSKALISGKSSQDHNSLLQGIDMIYQKLIKTFADSGVKKMEIKTGDLFDVNFHEALLQMPAPDIAEGCIVQVAQDGYMLLDKVLRHAKVVTSSGQPV
jgi:molecular chaperone GrpE